MAVHGRYRKSCPVCGSPVQRIRYAENEVNYCATCQTGGRVLADRALSRLLQEDWPRSLEEWEARLDRKSTRLNSSHTVISYAVFCLKKKKKQKRHFVAQPEGRG